MTTILSYGGGVNSTALLLEWLHHGNTLDALIFADTGSERPETYTYIEKYTKPFCKDNQIVFETVTRGHLPQHFDKDGKYINIYDNYFGNNSFPAVYIRSCTKEYKVTPINRLIKEKYPDAIQLIGIDAGESRRAKMVEDPETGEMISLYPEKKYPLLDWEIDRDGCIEIITKHGWPSPIKSGCFFCPFQKREQWKELYNTHPALYMKAEAMETNAKNFPKQSLMLTNPKRLDWFKRAIETQTTLEGFSDSETVADIPCMCYDG